MISSFIHEAMRLLARYENLALVVSALLGSGAIVCAAFALASILKKRSAKARGMVWRMALVMLLVLGAWRLMPEVSEPVAVVQWQVPVAPVSIDLPVTVPSEPLVIPKPGVWTRITRLADEHAKSLWLGVGALLLLWRVLAAWAGVMWLWRRSEPATENVQKLGEAIGAPPSLRYRVVEKIASPMLTGWRRPVVWLPVESKAWSDERLMAVLRHEMAHARHADVLWHWLSTFVVCLWWWQPLAWLGRRGLRLESEQAADDAAVLQSGDTQTYARTLVEIAAGMPAKLRHAAGVTMFGGGEVKQRVEALLRANRWRGRIGRRESGPMNDTLARVPPHRLAGWARLVLLLLVLCAAWALLYGWSVRAEAQDAPQVLTLAEMAPGLPGSPAEWRAVTLPDTWARHGLGRFGPARYRARLVLEAAPAEVWALRIDRLSTRADVRVNGALVHGTLAAGPNALRRPVPEIGRAHV